MCPDSFRTNQQVILSADFYGLEDTHSKFVIKSDKTHTTLKKLVTWNLLIFCCYILSLFCKHTHVLASWIKNYLPDICLKLNEMWGHRKTLEIHPSPQWQEVSENITATCIVFFFQILKKIILQEIKTFEIFKAWR